MARGMWEGGIIVGNLRSSKMDHDIYKKALALEWISQFCEFQSKPNANFHIHFSFSLVRNERKHLKEIYEEQSGAVHHFHRCDDANRLIYLS